MILRHSDKIHYSLLNRFFLLMFLVLGFKLVFAGELKPYRNAVCAIPYYGTTSKLYAGADYSSQKDAAQDFPSSQAKLLEQAYLEKSTVKLEHFFQEWEEESNVTAIDYSKQTNQIKRACAEVLMAAFDLSRWSKELSNEKDLVQYLDSSIYYCLKPEMTVFISNEKLYYSKNEKFDLAKNNLYCMYGFDTSLAEKHIKENVIIHRDTNWQYIKQLIYTQTECDRDEAKNLNVKKLVLNNFTPKGLFHTKKVLFLSRKYERKLLKFIHNKSNGLMLKQKNRDLNFELEVDSRLRFLRPNLFAFRDYWGELKIASLPEPDYIVFSEDLKIAQIHFLTRFGGQVVVLIKNGANWQVEEFGFGWQS